MEYERSKLNDVDENSERKATVLVIDDVQDVRDTVECMLSARYCVATAASGEEGWEVAQRSPPDLILTDVCMPGMDGYELLRRIRSHPVLHETPVLVITGYPTYDSRLQLLRAGAHDFIEKPFSAEELLLRVSTFVTLKRATDALRTAVGHQAANAAHLAEQVLEHQAQLRAALEVADHARTEAEKASTRKTRLLHMVSHELRTPLASMRLQVERFLEYARDRDDAFALRVGTSIEQASRRLTEVAEVLPSRAQLDAQRVAVVAEPLDLVQLVHEEVETLRPRAEERALRIQLDVGAPVPLLCSDARLVRLVVRNLIGNAVRHTHTGGIRVAVEGDAGAHRIAVSDTGPGICVADRQRVFEPYEQLGEQLDGEDRGVGLGLALVHQLVRALEGQVELASADGGEGTLFTVTLPELPFGAELGRAVAAATHGKPGSTLA